MKLESLVKGVLAVTISGFAAAELPAQATTPEQAVVKYDPNSHFAKRIAVFKEDLAELPADTTGTIVMVGDSITEAFTRSGVLPEKIHGIRILNQGISGDQVDRPTSGTGVTHRMEYIEQAKPALVFVMIGINDFWGGKEKPEEVIPQYEKMFGMLKDTVPNAKIVVQSVLPTSQEKSNLNPYVDQLNARTKELAEESGDMYLDLHPLMEDEKGELKAEYTGDGVHLNEEAYNVWLKKLEEVIPQLLQ